MIIVALVGMSGSGKSEVAQVFEDSGFARIRFGDITDKEILKRELELNEANERRVREKLREEHGMAAYAILNIPAINTALHQSNVIVDGLYSWEEHKLLRDTYNNNLIIVAVYSSPRTRQNRLSSRRVRPLSKDESLSRDFAEIENLNKGGPIAMADYTLENESSMVELVKNTKRLIGTIVK